MQRRPPLTFARFVALPENRTALAAFQDLADRLGSSASKRVVSRIYLHGAAGIGKSHLVAALIDHGTRRYPRLVVVCLTADDLNTWAHAPQSGSEFGLRDRAVDSDLVVVEDVQHVHRSSTEAMVGLFDALEARAVPMVFTANVGPRGLDLPLRLRSRFASGLVIGAEPYGPESRLALLKDQAGRRQIPVGTDALSWLASLLPGSGRELDGALTKIEAFGRSSSRKLDAETVTELFSDQAEASRPTVERITERVSTCFCVAARDLQSSRRSRQVLVPRQVSMYLARQLTPLSLEQIGSYFGGRDHSTVLHACRKVEKAITQDPVLSGTVRQLHAELA